MCVVCIYLVGRTLAEAGEEILDEAVIGFRRFAFVNYSTSEVQSSFACEKADHLS